MLVCWIVIVIGMVYDCNFNCFFFYRFRIVDLRSWFFLCCFVLEFFVIDDDFFFVDFFLYWIGNVYVKVFFFSVFEYYFVFWGNDFDFCIDLMKFIFGFELIIVNVFVDFYVVGFNLIVCCFDVSWCFCFNG